MLTPAFKTSALPLATRFFATRLLRRVPALMEATGAALQSKRGGGYAATWQETAGALNFIRRAAPVLFDVGANCGHWSSSLLERLPTVEHLVLFEPQPACWPALSRLETSKVHLHKVAVSDIAASVQLWANTNSEISSLYEQAGGGTASVQITVPAITLDDFIAQHGLTVVDYIKIDVEGHELPVIRGARRSIEAGIIKAFSFEFGPADVSSRTFFRDLWEALQDMRLLIFRLGHDGVAIRIDRYTHDLESFGGVANYVASVEPPKRCR